MEKRFTTDLIPGRSTGRRMAIEKARKKTAQFLPTWEWPFIGRHDIRIPKNPSHKAKPIFEHFFISPESPA